MIEEVLLCCVPRGNDLVGGDQTLGPNQRGSEMARDLLRDGMCFHRTWYEGWYVLPSHMGWYVLASHMGRGSDIRALTEGIRDGT